MASNRIPSNSEFGLFISQHLTGTSQQMQRNHRRIDEIIDTLARMNDRLNFLDEEESNIHHSKISGIHEIEREILMSANHNMDTGLTPILRGDQPHRFNLPREKSPLTEKEDQTPASLTRGDKEKRYGERESSFMDKLFTKIIQMQSRMEGLDRKMDMILWILQNDIRTANIEHCIRKNIGEGSSSMGLHNTDIHQRAPNSYAKNVEIPIYTTNTEALNCLLKEGKIELPLFDANSELRERILELK